MKQKTKKLNELVTRDFLEKALTGFSETIRSEIQFGINKISEIFDRKLTKHTDLILTTVDPLLKELEDRRQDREIGADQTAKITKQVEKLEERVEKLEHPPPNSINLDTYSLIPYHKIDGRQ